MRRLVLAALLILATGAACPTAFAETTPSGASPIASAERMLYQRAIDAILAHRYAEGRRLAAEGRSEIGSALVTWLWLIQPDTTAGIRDFADFIEEHPHWPKRWTLKRQLETLLANDPDDATVRGWFSRHPPVTGLGMVRYGEALIVAGEKEKGIGLIRHGFVIGHFTRAQETAILRRDRKTLSTADVEARLERLIWYGRLNDAKHLLLRVPPPERALAEARIALSEMRPGVEWYLARVPASLRNDPSLIFDRARWRRKKGLDDAAAALLERPGVDRRHADLWWQEKEIEARRQLADGNITRAYRLTLHHGPIEGAALAESEWLAGWIMLRFLGNEKAALHHFARFLAIVHTPVSRARGAYWYGRAEAALGEKALARHWYKVAAGYPTTFYGQVAALRLGDRGALKLPIADPPTADQNRVFARSDLVQAAEILTASGHRELVDPFISRLIRDAKTAAAADQIARLATQLGRPDLAIRTAKSAAEHGIFLLAYDYPLMARVIPARRLKNPNLVLAVSRQESAFKPTAESPAGALGIMQLMPATAHRIAHEMHLPFHAGRLLTDPAYNVRLGSHYLEHLIDKYHGSYVLALAAYNAGDNNVAKWVGNWGNPRRRAVNVLDWIELIPFAETRNYVERVMETLEVYRALRHPGAPVLEALAADLRGQPEEPDRAEAKKHRAGRFRDARIARRRGHRE